jgi:hypothetical protein
MRFIGYPQNVRIMICRYLRRNLLSSLDLRVDRMSRLVTAYLDRYDPRLKKHFIFTFFSGKDVIIMLKEKNTLNE